MHNNVENALIVEAANSFHYELYGVINHYGNISNGHYVADCKHDGVWFNFDDH